MLPKKVTLVISQLKNVKKVIFDHYLPVRLRKRRLEVLLYFHEFICSYKKKNLMKAQIRLRYKEKTTLVKKKILNVNEQE